MRLHAWVLMLLLAGPSVVVADDRKSTAWFRLAAEQGRAEAQHFLGLAYYEGRGVVKDPSEAAVWFREAAERGHAEAQFRLALSCFGGIGVPRDSVQGFAWASLSAMAGDGFALRFRDAVSAKLTPDQVAEAQALSRQLFAALDGSGSMSTRGR